ncbi:MAG TPA: hypothetical protein DCO78_09765 [Chitinophagaceae bacterium]|nr:hypothetical protein [Chitinophagaceae bacterium]
MIKIVVFFIVVYIVLKIIKYFLDLNSKELKVGMSIARVERILGAPGLKESKILKKDIVKETYFYGEKVDNNGKKSYQYKIVFVNQKAVEIHEY